MSSGERIASVGEFGFGRLFDELLTEVDSLGGPELDDAGLAAERLVRRAEAHLCSVVDRVDHTGHYRVDGHRSPISWCVAVTSCSRRDAARRVRIARALRELPILRSAFQEGRIGPGQVNEVTRRWSNPRCRALLPASEQLLTDLGIRMAADDFAIVMRRWEACADPDGTHRVHQAAVDARHVVSGWLGCEWHVRIQCGSLAGAEMEAILERFTEIEFERDWADAVAIHGERNVTAELLARTHAQRRFDALHAIFRLANSGDAGPPTVRRAHDDRSDRSSAAAAEPAADHTDEAGGEPIQDSGGGTPRPHSPPGPARRASAALFNVIIDWETWQREKAHLIGVDPPPTGRSRFERYRCETDRGHPLDPHEVFHATLTGRIRRAVVDASGRITDLGRTSRLFTGAARDTALLQHHRCLWPGCQIPASRCEADHLTPWAMNGATSPRNGGPLCDHHNRHKARYTSAATPNDEGGQNAQPPDG